MFIQFKPYQFVKVFVRNVFRCFEQPNNPFTLRFYFNLLSLIHSTNEDVNLSMFSVNVFAFHTFIIFLIVDFSISVLLLRSSVLRSCGVPLKKNSKKFFVKEIDLETKKTD